MDLERGIGEDSGGFEVCFWKANYELMEGDWTNVTNFYWSCLLWGEQESKTFYRRNLLDDFEEF